MHLRHGPYVVLRKTSALNYEVKRPQARKKQLVHVVKMNKFAEETSGDGEEERKESEKEV